MKKQIVSSLYSGPACFAEDGTRLLRSSSVSKRIGKTTRTVRIFATRGVIPAFKKGKLWFFKLSDVESYLNSLEQEHQRA